MRSCSWPGRGAGSSPATATRSSSTRAEPQPGPRMSELDPPPADRRSLSDDKERNRILEEVLRDQARREVLRDIAYRIPRSSMRTRIGAAALGAVALVLWLAPIPWLRPEIAFPLPKAEEDA